MFLLFIFLTLYFFYLMFVSHKNSDKQVVTFCFAAVSLDLSTAHVDSLVIQHAHGALLSHCNIQHEEKKKKYNPQEITN